MKHLPVFTAGSDFHTESELDAYGRSPLNDDAAALLSIHLPGECAALVTQTDALDAQLSAIDAQLSAIDDLS